MLKRLREDITADEYAALLEVKGLIAEGKIQIRMCRSDGCIGGEMAKIMGKEPGSYVSTGGISSGVLHRLFFFRLFNIVQYGAGASDHAILAGYPGH